MSGPIVRSGPSPLFSANWDKIFGAKKANGSSGNKSSKSAKKKAAPKRKPKK